MKPASLAILLIFISKFAYAEPVYIDCYQTSDGGDTTEFSLKIDEDNNKITHTSGLGFAFNTDGFFTADKITYQKIDMIRELKLTQAWKINRIDMSVQFKIITESVKFPEEMPPEILSKATGACSIVTLDEKRKL